MKGRLACSVLWIVLLLSNCLLVINVCAQLPEIGTLSFASDRTGTWDIYTIDIDGGNLRNLTNSPGNEFDPAWSPDGRFLAYVSNHKRNTEIYVMDINTGERRRLTDHPSFDQDPTWSPDSRWIAFSSNRKGNYHIYKMNVRGDKLQRLTTQGNNFSPAWSPDGQSIASYSTGVEGPHIKIIDANRKRESRLTRASAPRPAWSPDGEKIAFTHSEPDVDLDISLINTDGTDLKPLIQWQRWDTDPAWSPDGQWIAFTSEPQRKKWKERHPDQNIYILNVEKGELRQLTHHPEADLHPAWVPSAFLSVSPTLQTPTTLWGSLKKD